MKFLRCLRCNKETQFIESLAPLFCDECLTFFTTNGIVPCPECGAYTNQAGCITVNKWKYLTHECKTCHERGLERMRELGRKMAEELNDRVFQIFTSLPEKDPAMLTTGNELNLYLVQDADRPLYVLARSWEEARELWQQQIKDENQGECDEPQGISLVAVAEDVMVPLSRSGHSIPTDLHDEYEAVYKAVVNALTSLNRSSDAGELVKGVQWMRRCVENHLTRKNAEIKTAYGGSQNRPCTTEQSEIQVLQTGISDIKSILHRNQQLTPNQFEVLGDGINDIKVGLKDLKERPIHVTNAYDLVPMATLDKMHESLRDLIRQCTVLHPSDIERIKETVAVTLKTNLEQLQCEVNRVESIVREVLPQEIRVTVEETKPIVNSIWQYHNGIWFAIARRGNTGSYAPSQVHTKEGSICVCYEDGLQCYPNVNSDTDREIICAAYRSVLLHNSISMKKIPQPKQPPRLVRAIWEWQPNGTHNAGWFLHIGLMTEKPKRTPNQPHNPAHNPICIVFNDGQEQYI